MLSRARQAVFAALAALALDAAAAVCTSQSSGNWGVAGRWSCGHVPTTATGDSVVIGNNHSIAVNIANAGGISLDISTGTSASTVTINAGQTLTITGNVTLTPAALNNNTAKTLAVGAGTLLVGGDVVLNGPGAGNRFADLTISTGLADIGGSLAPANARSRVTFTGAGTVRVGVDFASTGAFTPATGTFVYDGAGAQAVGAYTYNHLTVAKTAGTASLVADSPVGGNLAVTGGTLDLGAFSADRTAAGGTLTVANGATLRIGGTNGFPANYATRTLGLTSTVDYGGTTQSVTPEAYGNLALSGSGTKAATGALTVNGNVSIAAGATFGMGASNHAFKGNFTNNGGTAPANSTATFSGTVAQVVSGSATTFNHVVVANAAGVTASVPLAMANFTVNAGSTFNASTASHSLTGAFANNGTFNAGTSTFRFNGNSTQTITGATTFHNLTSATLNPGGSGIALSSNVRVANTLAFDPANVSPIATGANKLTLSPAATITGAGGPSCCWVNGRLEKEFTAAGAFNFAVGDATAYTPVNLTFTAMPTTGSLLVYTTAGSHPQLATSAIDVGGNIVNRWWTLQPTTLTGTFSATFTFVDADVNGDPFNYIVQRYDAGSWLNATVSANNPLSTAVTAVNGFGEFAIGEPFISAFLRDRELIFIQEVFH